MRLWKDWHNQHHCPTMLGYIIMKEKKSIECAVWSDAYFVFNLLVFVHHSYSFMRLNIMLFKSKRNRHHQWNLEIKTEIYQYKQQMLLFWCESLFGVTKHSWHLILMMITSRNPSGRCCCNETTGKPRCRQSCQLPWCCGCCHNHSQHHHGTCRGCGQSRGRW